MPQEESGEPLCPLSAGGAGGYCRRNAQSSERAGGGGEACRAFGRTCAHNFDGRAARSIFAGNFDGIFAAGFGVYCAGQRRPGRSGNGRAARQICQEGTVTCHSATIASGKLR
jgi:hypothetical protein